MTDTTSTNTTAEWTRRGELTVFLGVAGRAGTTHAMLQAAREAKKDGIDVAIGCLVGEPETLILARELAFVGVSQVGRERVPRELSVDDVLMREPQLVVIDDLAHSNKQDASRARRYQDVEAILVDGIDVYTTLNVYEIESYSDIIAKVTGMSFSQTVPDTFLETVNYFRLVDVLPDVLIKRFQARETGDNPRAVELEKLYRRGNLLALREMALRYTAQRVDRQLEDYMRSKEVGGPWPVSEKVMVCVSASPFSAQLIRFTRQIASNLKVDWLAVYVETPRRLPTSYKGRVRLEDNLQLAEDLGAEIVSITGTDVADELVQLARKRNVKEIVIGKPRHIRMWEWFHGSVVDKVIRNAYGISVHVIPGESDAQPGSLEAKSFELQEIRWVSYLIITIFIGLLTMLVLPFRNMTYLVNIALLYLLPVLIGAVRWGVRPSFYAAVVGLVIFDWFFVPPYYSFAVSDLGYIISFAVFLIVATITASLASRLRDQLHNAKRREAVTSALYTVSRQITAIGDLDTLLTTIVSQIAETVGTEVAVFLPNPEGELRLAARSDESSGWGGNQSEMTIARWVYRNGEAAGRGTQTLRESPGLYIPLRTEEHTHGVLAVNLASFDHLDASERKKTIEALGRLAAVAIARVKLSEEAKVAHLTAESEKLRTAILDSLSHELRTPLSTIIGAVTGLLDGGDVFSRSDRNELLATIREGAMRMNRLVTNLLSMVRLESGMLRLHKEFCDLEDIVGVALSQLRDSLQNHEVKVLFDKQIPAVPVDDILMEQVLVNVLSNAIKYSTGGSEIAIKVGVNDNKLTIEISDQGIGIPEQESERIFDKFYRSQRTVHITGTGLGLAISKGIVEAHGGKIMARPNGDKGTIITIFLPISGNVTPRVENANKLKGGV